MTNRNPAALICAGGALDHTRFFEVHSGNYTGYFRGSENCPAIGISPSRDISNCKMSGLISVE